MNEAKFDELARAELAHLEDGLDAIDPDELEVSTSDGVLTLNFRTGVRAVINSHRAARQIWMAAVASAWHFDYRADVHGWHDSKTGVELRETLAGLIREHLGIEVSLA